MTLAFDLKAEAIVVASGLYHRDDYAALQGMVQSRHFHVPIFARLWSVAARAEGWIPEQRAESALNLLGEPSDALYSAGFCNAAALMSQALPPAAAERYAHVVIDMHRRRQLQLALSECLDQLDKSAISCDAIARRAQSAISEVLHGKSQEVTL